MTDDQIKRGQRVRDIPGYKHCYDAYGRIGGEIVNFAELTNNDFTKAIVDILVANGLLVGVKTGFQVQQEAADKALSEIMEKE